ncbi:hypothetical protein RFI_14573 [Reticulomyxa filosa]|uniref:Sulfatase N-terminal domain-containing protein n=1 Tax=Reticulomyxa filosa TaxID=46433 RepID=X6NA30_RETFI|nr:hypothetical protein RFI_14573 [Reticulomyxa filosa]|eukprot:ETO22619.1 hypothetical protein RFI_14573 [Reticulomyxa filosa]
MILSKKSLLLFFFSLSIIIVIFLRIGAVVSVQSPDSTGSVDVAPEKPRSYPWFIDKMKEISQNKTNAKGKKDPKKKTSNCLSVLCLYFLGAIGKKKKKKKKDLILDGMSSMPKTLSLLSEKGMTFNNAFVTNPVCCPSRASILTGLYPHNTEVYNNSRRPWDGGCHPARFLSFIEHYSYQRFLHDVNYRPIDDSTKRKLPDNWRGTYDIEQNDLRSHLFQAVSFDEQLYKHSKNLHRTHSEYMTFHAGKYHNEYCCYVPPGTN